MLVFVIILISNFSVFVSKELSSIIFNIKCSKYIFIIFWQFGSWLTFFFEHHLTILCQAYSPLMYQLWFWHLLYFFFFDLVGNLSSLKDIISYCLIKHFIMEHCFFVLKISYTMLMILHLFSSFSKTNEVGQFYHL